MGVDFGEDDIDGFLPDQFSKLLDPLEDSPQVLEDLDDDVVKKGDVRTDIVVRCEPLIEILNARVFTDVNVSLDVYGDIRILDLESSKDFVFYARGRFDSPQHICSENLLQITSPPEIPTFSELQVVVDIKNVDTGAVVARGQMPILKTALEQSNDFEELLTLQFEGDGGLVDTGARVELQCVAFKFGVSAYVEMTLYKDDVADGGEQGVEVFGQISAKCPSLLLDKECYENHMLNVVKEEHVWVGLGTDIELFKNLVAVPAYSELEISVDLKGYEDDEFIVQGTACFLPTYGSDVDKDIRGVNGFYVRINVTWCEPYSIDNTCCNEDMIDLFSQMPHWPRLYASPLLEVFSLFIARPNGEELHLYGSVKIVDYRGWCSVFSCSKNEPYFLPQGCNLLPLQGPDRTLQPLMYFSMEIDLHDIEGIVNIKGFVTSCFSIEERQRPWFDRRFCAIVKLVNEESFAAVNYTLFSAAVQAVVEVGFQFRGKSSARVKIYGDIIASYDKLSYSSNYDVEFFKRVLFTRKKANFLEVEDDYQLSRYLVAVPMTSSLLTKVNLYFQTNSRTHRVGGLVKFPIGESYRIIKSDFVDICINVDWKGLSSYV